MPLFFNALICILNVTVFSANVCCIACQSVNVQLLKSPFSINIFLSALCFNLSLTVFAFC